jgi:hypothetical protein
MEEQAKERFQVVAVVAVCVFFSYGVIFLLFVLLPKNHLCTKKTKNTTNHPLL